MEFCYGSRSQLGLVLDWILDFHAKYRDKKTFAATSFDHVIGKGPTQLVWMGVVVFVGVFDRMPKKFAIIFGGSLESP